MTLLDFSKGMSVRYIGHAHNKHRQTAKVIRPVKSRQVVTIEWDIEDLCSPWFDARPENLELVA